MMAQNSGIKNLASVLQGRMKETAEYQSTTYLELGTIMDGLGLKLDNFSETIPRSDYMVSTLCYMNSSHFTYKDGEHTHAPSGKHTHPSAGEPSHTHPEAGEHVHEGDWEHVHASPSIPSLRPLVAGDRVLVGWAGTEPVVICKVIPGSGPIFAG